MVINLIMLLDKGRHPTPEIGTEDHTIWEILKEVWALNNGFLDENGDVITIAIYGNVVGDNLTPAEHEAAGFYNPFREGSYEKYHRQTSDRRCVSGRRLP